MSSSKKVVAIIPARYGSTRLPAKPLALIHGMTMIERVYRQVQKARSVHEIWIATDHSEIERVAKAFGAKVMMTSPDLQSGTDRVAAVARQVPGDIFVNVQGDEPILDPQAIDRAVDRILIQGDLMASCMTRLPGPADLDDPSTVKVLVDAHGYALYFSRFPIPYSRGRRPSADSWSPLCRKHLGLYVYTREMLERFSQMPVSELEQAEMLEQLRVLAAGVRIGMAEVHSPALSVDTPEDLERVNRFLVESGRSSPQT